MEKHITLPLTEELAKTLHAGDSVYLTGTIYTSRDAGHKRMCETLARGEALPFDPMDATIYYVGPTPAKPGQVIGSAGPTTSGRMDAYAPTMMSVGARGMIGKGARLPEVIEAMKQYHGVYFGAVGGAGALLAKCIKKSELIAYEDLGAEALRKLSVEDLPVVVVIDCEGNNLYESGRRAYLAAEVPPVKEPDRQYYYMAKLKKVIAEKSARLGRPLTCCVTTFGCQMNARDSEKLRGILEEVGYVTTESEDADFVIYNTCTVRENANVRVYGRLGSLKNFKRKNPEMLIGLCGCMMQEPHVVEKLKKSYSYVDLIFGTHNIFKFAELLYTAMDSERMVIDIWKDTDQIVEDLPVDRKYPFKSGVNIMFGCNNFCSYCIVPYVRGRERSREPEAILSEIRRLAEDGVTEIMLLGQNVNSYGKNLEHPMTFAQLLREIERIEGIHWIRFMTSHPKDLSEELIEVMRDSKKICHHMHLPLQSGSDRMLKEMNRHYDKARYLSLVEKLREAVPDISLTTDIIVGFPGETEEDFLETMDVVEKSDYDTAFTFIYSKRTGTPAAAKEDQVPEDVIKDRFDRLLALVQKKGHIRSSRFLDTVQEVLVEEQNREPGVLTGRTQHNLLVHFKGEPSLIGQYVKVHLDESRGFYYFGSLVE